MQHEKNTIRKQNDIEKLLCQAKRKSKTKIEQKIILR